MLLNVERKYNFASGNASWVMKRFIAWSTTNISNTQNIIFYILDWNFTKGTIAGKLLEFNINGTGLTSSFNWIITLNSIGYLTITRHIDTARLLTVQSLVTFLRWQIINPNSKTWKPLLVWENLILKIWSWHRFKYHGKESWNHLTPMLPFWRFTWSPVCLSVFFQRPIVFIRFKLASLSNIRSCLYSPEYSSMLPV